MFALFALVACDIKGGGGGASNGSGAKVAESGTKRGSAGGFSATMGQELGAPEGTLGAAAPGAAPSANAPAGAAPSTAPATAAGSATAAAGSATAAAGTAPAGSAAASDSAAAGAAMEPAKGSAAPAPANSAAEPAVAAAPANAGAAAAPAKGGGAAAPTGSLSKRAPVKPSAELAAIKFDLEPNWDRDVGEAGTFSLVVKVPNTEEMRVFSVRYGYEDPAAPFDCDQYRKFLDDKKTMKVTLNRQRGAACYIEGTDTNGVIAYRYLVNYGGKRLMCHGSLYKDAASQSLGDLRDKVLMQAKKICETLAL